MADIAYNATGKRKDSVARVTLTPGSGNITVNKRTVDDYFPRETLRMIIRMPLEVTSMSGKFDIAANVHGGGMSGQAGAIRHGIAKALLLIDGELRSPLKKEGFITRDPRNKERKKFGQKAARARFQFSKR
ncbi:MAG: 30S ribosomal protein S9 [Nitrospirae bacterium]|nr:30S ribosomal protein S9 [Nitrospirota bacterium]